MAERFSSFLQHLVPASVVGRKDQQRRAAKPYEDGNAKTLNYGKAENAKPLLRLLTALLLPAFVVDYSGLCPANVGLIDQYLFDWRGGYVISILVVAWKCDEC